MNHSLTTQQVLQQRAEISRRYHLMLINLDEQMRDLEAAPPPIAELHLRKTAIEQHRAEIVAEWEHEKASWRN
jgi:hypothetical protein